MQMQIKYKKLKYLNRVSITRDGLVGVLHFNARNLKRTKRTGTWTKEEIKIVERNIKSVRDKLFPEFK